MTALAWAGAWLTMALVFESAGVGPTAHSREGVPASAIAQAQGEVMAQAQEEPARPRAGRQTRRTRMPRTSKRKPYVAAPESLDEPRTSRDAGQRRQDLSLTANLLAGYDDNLIAGSGTGAGVVPTTIVSGSTGFADGTLDYFRGNTSRAIRMASTGSLRAYPGYLDRPAAGGAATLEARTRAGRKLVIRASQRVAYEPSFSVFTSRVSGPPAPAAGGETVPAAGLFERRSLSATSTASTDYAWTRRDSTSVAYSYLVQQFTNIAYGDHRAHDLRAEHRRNVARGVRARAAYEHARSEHIGFDGIPRPRREHRVEVGPAIEKALSRRRHLSLSLGAGASRIESIRSSDREPYHAWVPVGSGSATLHLTPMWNVDGGYRRDFSLLRGITDEVYRTDTAFLTTGGLVSARTDLRIGTTYSSLQTPLASGADDTFRVYGASLQVGIALTPTLAAAAGYYYYHHRYSNPGALPAGFPAEYDRHAFRVGLTLRLALMGAPPRTR
jgi:hypothetical protein